LCRSGSRRLWPAKACWATGLSGVVTWPPALVQVREEPVEATRRPGQVVLGSIADRQQSPCYTGFLVIWEIKGGDPAMPVAQPAGQVSEQLVIVHTTMVAPG